MAWFAKPKADRVLVVDDDPDVAAYIQDVLLTAGVESLVAHDGRTAIKLAQEESPRLILLDVSMPDWDGLKTLTQLRVHEETRKIPVLMVTAHQTGKDVDEAFQRGAVGYVIKPIDLPRFLAKVGMFVAVKGA
jgi:DNA-binding response OmpR family regulator